MRTHRTKYVYARSDRNVGPKCAVKRQYCLFTILQYPSNSLHCTSHNIHKKNRNFHDRREFTFYFFTFNVFQFCKEPLTFNG